MVLQCLYYTYLLPEPHLVDWLVAHEPWAKGNIARGTTDPEIDSETWTKLGNNMAPLALIANLATGWRHMTFSH